MMLTNRQFDRTQQLALRLAGIELVERHRELLQRRSQRLGIRDGAGLDLLLYAAEAGEPAATQQLLCLLTTKFTGFFRHPRHFEIAARHAFEAAKRRGSARLWSAGTATGEEAWSLAMAVTEAFQPEAPAVSILATDLDAEALATALRGDYGGTSLQVLAPERRERFFRDTSVPNRFSVVTTLRRWVVFQTLNLVAPDWPVEGPFDVIFCRNVLMYLEGRHRHAALERVAALLASDGVLLLDPAEHLGSAGHLFVSNSDGLYSVRRSGGSGERRQTSTSKNAALSRAAAMVQAL